MVSNGKHNFEDKKHYISVLAVFQITEFPILKKQETFFDVYLHETYRLMYRFQVD